MNDNNINKLKCNTPLSIINDPNCKNIYSDAYNNYINKMFEYCKTNNNELHSKCYFPNHLSYLRVYKLKMPLGGKILKNNLFCLKKRSIC